MAVDDEPDGLEALCLILKLHGAEVRCLLSAAEALDELAAFCPTVLISDLHMPEMDGFGLIARIRALPREACGRVAAVAFSAYASPESRARAFEAGYQRFVVKPASPAQIVDTILALVSG
jgi:CheY-like chemotaxis protein